MSNAFAFSKSTLLYIIANKGSNKNDINEKKEHNNNNNNKSRRAIRCVSQAEIVVVGGFA